MTYRKEKMNRDNKKSKLNISIYLSVFLTILTIITIHITSGILARYTISGTSIDSSKVIKFGALDIKESGDYIEENKMMIIPGVDLNKKAIVEFSGSNSSAYVFLEILNLPTGRWSLEDNKTFSLQINSTQIMQWAVNDNWIYLTSTEDKRHIYYQKIEANHEFKENIIYDNLVMIDEHITKDAIEHLNEIGNIGIKFRAAAVQSLGFENVNEAWASISSK